jgi:multiple antibiotic resistance protein
MFFSLKEFFTVTMILFAVIDIIGSIPILIELRSKVGELESRKASIASLCIMVVFFFLGDSILELIGLDIKSFAIAGSIVLFFIAMEMILGIRIYKDSANETASIVPIAFPLIAGAGTLTTLISLKAEYHTANIMAAIVANVVIVYFVLRNVKHIERLLSTGGINILRKVFGIILLAIAIKLFRTNAGV